MLDFRELVEASSVFSSTAAPQTSTAALDGIPRLHRTVAQVDAHSHHATHTRMPAGSQVYPAALRLLSEKGFAADRLRRAVADMQKAPLFMPQEQSYADSDVRAVLSEQRNAIPVRAADDARLRTNAMFRDRFRQTMQADLEREKNDIVRVLALRNEHAKARSPEGSMHSAARNTPTTRTSLTPKGTEQLALFLPSVDPQYLTAIRSVLLEGDAPSVASLMHETSQIKMDHPHLVEALAILANVSSFIHEEQSPANYIRVHAARTVLEDQFAESTNVLPVKPRLASPAAVRAGVLQYVTSLAAEGRLAAAGSGAALVDGQPLWPQVYYCFRVGNPHAALHIVSAAYQAGHHELASFVTLLTLFLTVREESATHRPASRSTAPERGMSDAQGVESAAQGEAALDSPRLGSLREARDYHELVDEYRTVAWSSGDMYCRVCFVLLARLELTPSSSGNSDMHAKLSDTSTISPYPSDVHQERISLPLPDSDFNAVFGSVEDYMWMRLWLCRTELEASSTGSLEQFNFVSLRQIQEELVACGPAHFDPSGVQPFLYAFVLVCAGLYWEAVEFLAAQADERYIAGAAHIAMVLHLLRWVNSSQQYASVLWSYVSLFAKSQPAEAATYLLTIRDRELLLEWLQRLLLDTNEFAILLGSSSNPADTGALQDIVSRMPEAYSVISRDDIEVLRKTVAKRVAYIAREREDFQRAGEMFALAGDRERSLQMLLRSIAAVVDDRNGTSRAFPLAEGRRVYKDMQRTGETGPIPRSMYMILAIASFFDEYNAGQFGIAWKVLQSTRILPLTTESIAARRADLLPSSDRFDDAVRLCIPPLVRAGLDICERALIDGSVFRDSAKSSASPSSRWSGDFGSPEVPRPSQIKALVTFSGLMGLSETEVNARLVRIELLMA